MTVMEVGERVLLLSAAEENGEELSKIMDSWKPDVVALEFCYKREEVAFNTEMLGERRLIEYLREKGSFFGLVSQMFYFSVHTSIQHDSFSASPRTLAAIEEASRRRVETRYIDQNLDIMVKRAWKQVSFSEKVAMARLFKQRLLSTGTSHKEKGIPFSLMIDKIMDVAPSSKKVLVGERQEHMALEILEASQDRKILAVVEEEHIEPMADIIRNRKPNPERREELETAPKKFRLIWIRWILTGFLVSLFIYTLHTQDWEQTRTIIRWWFLATSISAALGAIVARGHPYSVMSAFASAPFISFTFIGAGWIAGLVELKVRKPTVKDVMALGSMSTKRELFTNNCTKPLAVGLITNAGNWIGIIVVLPIIISSLA